MIGVAEKAKKEGDVLSEATEDMPMVLKVHPTNGSPAWGAGR